VTEDPEALAKSKMKSFFLNMLCGGAQVPPLGRCAGSELVMMCVPHGESTLDWGWGVRGLQGTLLHGGGLS
jgi:hypothetical protein